MSVPPAKLLEAFSAELFSTRGGVNALAGLVSDYVRNCPLEARPTALRDAQAVDALAQHLDALSDFARRMSGGEPFETAVAAVPLSDLADRLRAAVQSPVHHREDACAAGEVLLFEQVE